VLEGCFKPLPNVVNQAVLIRIKYNRKIIKNNKIIILRKMLKYFKILKILTLKIIIQQGNCFATHQPFVVVEFP